MEDYDDPLHGNWWLPWHWTGRQRRAVLIIGGIVFLLAAVPTLALIAALMWAGGLT